MIIIDAQSHKTQTLGRSGDTASATTGFRPFLLPGERATKRLDTASMPREEPPAPAHWSKCKLMYHHFAIYFTIRKPKVVRAVKNLLELPIWDRARQ